MQKQQRVPALDVVRGVWGWESSLCSFSSDRGRTPSTSWGRGRVPSRWLFIVFGCFLAIVPVPSGTAQILNSYSQPLTRCEPGEGRQGVGLLNPVLSVWGFPSLWVLVEVDVLFRAPQSCRRRWQSTAQVSQGTCSPRHEKGRSPKHSTRPVPSLEGIHVGLQF